MSGSVSLRSREGRDDQRVVKSAFGVLASVEAFRSQVAFLTLPGVSEDD